jgi:hypothetical protein
VFFNFIVFTNFSVSYCLTFFQRGVICRCEQSLDSSLGSSHRSWDVNWLCKQSSVVLAFSFGLYVISKGPWTAVGAFVSFLFIRNFTIGHRAWGVTSQLHTFVLHRLSAFLPVIHLMILATQLTAVLHSGSRVTYHSFVKLHLRFNKLSRPGRSLLRSKSVILLVDSLYTETMEAVKSWTTLSALSTGPEWFLVIGRLVDDLSAECQRQWLLIVGHSSAQQYRAHHHFPQVGLRDAEISNSFLWSKFSSFAPEGLETALFQNGCLAFISPASTDSV